MAAAILMYSIEIFQILNSYGCSYVHSKSHLFIFMLIFLYLCFFIFIFMLYFLSSCIYIRIHVIFLYSCFFIFIFMVYFSCSCIYVHIHVIFLYSCYVFHIYDLILLFMVVFLFIFTVYLFILMIAYSYSRFACSYTCLLIHIHGFQICPGISKNHSTLLEKTTHSGLWNSGFAVR